MPYILPERRKQLDELVKELGNVLRFDGDLNYVLFALCKRYVPPGYGNLKNFLGELREVENEIRRRILAPYEDEKIEENGDIE